MNVVYNGVNENRLELAGLSASDVVSFYSDILGLDEDAVMKVNDVEVDGNYVIEDEDVIEFVKEAGTKGASGDVVIVHSGINKVTIEIADNDTVATVLEKASQLLGVSGIELQSTVNLNGESSPSSAPVFAGDNLEVVKEAGTKG